MIQLQTLLIHMLLLLPMPTSPIYLLTVNIYVSSISSITVGGVPHYYTFVRTVFMESTYIFNRFVVHFDCIYCIEYYICRRSKDALTTYVHTYVCMYVCIYVCR